MMNVVPFPGVVRIDSSPCSSLTAIRLTTSMPTPRPLVVVTSVLVDRPGRVSSASSASSPAGSGWFALRATATGSTPRPSSLSVSSSRLSARSRQVTEMRPISGFPAARRSSGDSSA